MQRIVSLAASFAVLALAGPGIARDRADRAAELPAYIQCAPYARSASGIQLFGEAREWFAQARGKYRTGNTPREGAVMAFRAHGAMHSGHVAVVSKVLDSRRVLLDHANWSPINGRRGQVEKGVLAIDASPAGDWSQVRVWYAPIGAVGTGSWPLDGFIYPERAAGAAQAAVLASAQSERAQPQPAEPSRQFQQAFAKFE